jgi:hypothetical protein
MEAGRSRAGLNPPSASVVSLKMCDSYQLKQSYET